jgi:hypothetical protein
MSTYEVFSSLWDNIGMKLHSDASNILSTDFHIEIDLWIRHQSSGGSRKRSLASMAKGGVGARSESRCSCKEGSGNHGNGELHYIRREKSKILLTVNDVCLID